MTNITLTVQQMINANMVFTELLKLSLSGKTGFLVNIYIKTLKPFIDQYEKQRIDKCTELSESKTEIAPDGSSYFVLTDEQKQLLNAEMIEILKVPHDVNITKLKLSDIEKLEFPGVYHLAIEPFVELD